MYSLLIRPITRRIKDSGKASAIALRYFKFEGMIPGGRFFNRLIHGNRPVTYVRLQGLSSGAVYRDEESGKTYPADALMEAGLPMPVPFGEYGATQIRFKSI